MKRKLANLGGSCVSLLSTAFLSVNGDYISPLSQPAPGRHRLYQRPAAVKTESLVETLLHPKDPLLWDSGARGRDRKLDLMREVP